jgi:hypothetical protein
MTLTLTLGLVKQMLMLAELSDHDWEMSEGILEGIDCEHDVKLLPDPLIGSTSTKNYGGYATLGCRSLNKVHLTVFDNH